MKRQRITVQWDEYPLPFPEISVLCSSCERPLIWDPEIQAWVHRYEEDGQVCHRPRFEPLLP